MRMITNFRWVFVGLLLSWASLAQAAWQLSADESSLTFVTTKATHVAEVHSFKSLTGSVDEQGRVTVSVALASVDTLIPIRDERMREFLFDVVNFPTARLTAQIEIAALLAMSVGETRSFLVAGELELKESKVAVSLAVTAGRLAEDRLLVASAQPVIVNAGTVGLLDGVAKLKELAGLPSISQAVPVSFVLVFESAAQAPLDAANARMRQPIPGQNKSAGYVELTNTSQETLRLIGADSDDIGSIELHTIKRDGDMLRMRRLKEMVIAPGQTLSLASGGHHLMMFRVGEIGDAVNIRLRTAEHGSLEVPFRVVGLDETL